MSSYIPKVIGELITFIKDNGLEVPGEIQEQLDRQFDDYAGDEPDKYSLEGVDGNAFMIGGYVRIAMKKENFSRDEIEEYTRKSTSGDYDNLLRVSFEQIEKCNERAKTREESAC